MINYNMDIMSRRQFSTGFRLVECERACVCMFRVLLFQCWLALFFCSVFFLPKKIKMKEEKNWIASSNKRALFLKVIHCIIATKWRGEANNNNTTMSS